jgi:hypothetical protein
MGYIETEQAVRLIETTTNAIKTTQPEPEPTNYWWLLLIGVVPVFVGWLLTRKKKS